MRRNNTYKTVITALFAALVCVATMFIRVHSPTGGYVNLGDGIVLLSAYLLGPVYGMLAAGIGSMLADILSGYPAYVPGTLIIKGVMALAAGSIWCVVRAKNPTRVQRLGCFIVAGICAEAIMVLGYLFYSGVCLSYGAGAVADIPGNLVQGAFGIAVSTLLTPQLLRSPELREMTDRFRS